MTDRELHQSVQNIDWNRLTRVYVANPLTTETNGIQVPTRTPAECRIRFFGNDDPNIKKTGWSKEEDKELLILAEEHRGHD